MDGKCSKVRELIPGYVLDELIGDERSTLEGHLAVCQDCSGLKRQYQVMMEEGRRLEPHVDFDAAWREIAAGIERQKRPHFAFADAVWTPKVAVVIAVLLIVTGLAFFLQRHQEVPPAMSVAEMEAILISLGEIKAERAMVSQSRLGEAQPALGSSGSERVLRFAGVSASKRDTNTGRLF